MDFYTNLLLGTVGSVIVVLIIMGYFMSLAKGKQDYPPSIANCPDNYTIDLSGNCTAPSTMTFLPGADKDCSYNNFSNKPFIATGTGFESGNCKKKLW